MFERYKTERNKIYMDIFRKTFATVFLYLLFLMIYVCIFFSSAKPLWLLIPLLIFAFYGLGKDPSSFTKNDPDTYYHSGGLFFVSYSEFLEKENNKCEKI